MQDDISRIENIAQMQHLEHLDLSENRISVLENLPVGIFSV